MSGEESSRTNQILQIDTHALLITLRELENKLSDYQRHDKIPVWANSLIPRLESLESKLSKSSKISVPTNHEDGNLIQGNLESVVEKLNKEFTSRIDIMKISFESQVSALNLEVDRLQKLLQIRPTTSEMQKVVLAVSEVKRDIQNELHEISSTVSLLVKDKLSEEMLSIMDRLKTNEINSERGIGLIMKKVENFGVDINDFKNSTESSILLVNKSQDEMKNHFNTFDFKFSLIDDNIENVKKDIQIKLDDLAEVQNLAQETFVDFRGETFSSLSKLEEENLRLDDFIKNVETTMNENEDKISTNILDLKDNFKDFKGLYEYDMDFTKTELKLLNESKNSHEKKLQEHEEYILKLKDFGLIDRVTVAEENIVRMQKQIIDFEERLTSQNNKIRKMDKLTQKVAEEMEAFPKHVQEQEAKMTQVVGFLDLAKIEMSDMKEAFTKASTQIAELFTMRDDVQYVRELGIAQDQRVKSVQASLDMIMESADEHDRLIDELTENLKKSESKFEDKLIEIRDSMSESFANKNTELEAAIQNLVENLDIIQQQAGDHNSLVGGSSTTEKKGSLDPGSILGGSSTTTLFTQPVSSSHTELIGDLCINFEGISVRKTAVQEIPETICEQLAMISQTVASIVANQTDTEALFTLIRGIPSEDISAESLSEKSQRRLDNFIESVKLYVEQNSDHPGVVRTEAREKFFSQLYKALQTSLSKHDQVLVVGNSRFGRIKIPSCIACDRPLLNKIRQENSGGMQKVPRSESGMAKPVHVMKSPIPERDDSFQEINERSLLSENSRKNLGSSNKKSIHLPTANMNSKGQKQMGVSQSAYIMRAGFKLPKASASVDDFSVDTSNISLPELIP